MEVSVASTAHAVWAIGAPCGKVAVDARGRERALMHGFAEMIAKRRRKRSQSHTAFSTVAAKTDEGLA